MSLTTAPATAQRLAQTMDNIRITEEEFKIKVEECNQLRLALSEAVQQAERVQLLLRKQENLTMSKNEALIKTQHSLDIVLKELTTKQQSIDALQSENARLKRDVESTQRHSGDVVKTLQSKSLSREVVGGLKDAPASLYVQQCFRAGCDPHTDVVRGLHAGTSIEAVRPPMSFQQLNALCEVLEMKRTLDPLNASGGELSRLAIAVASDESLLLVAQLIRSHPTLREIEIHGLRSLASGDIAGALATSEHIVSVAFPGLRVNDAGLQALMKVVNNREQLYLSALAAFTAEVAAAHEAKNEALVAFLEARGPTKSLLKIESLDLSQSQLCEPKSFEMIRGQAMRRLDFTGCTFLMDHHVGEVVRSCPQLESLCVAQCPQLTNDTVSYINTTRSVTHVAALGCTSMSKLNFFYVETLETDLCGVSHLECAALKSLPVPIQHFSLVSFICPALEEVTFRGLTLCDRELRMIADSVRALTHLGFIKCRLSGADFFFRMVRTLTHISLHACKGITDTEIMCLCSRLQSIDLTDGYCLTDKSIKYIANTCTGLTHLTLKRCSNITDQGIVCLMHHASLEFLNMLSTKKVTIVALHRVLASLVSIKRVIHETLVSATIQVDRDDVEEVGKAFVESQQAALLAQREVAALHYVSSASPPRQQRVPRPPTGDSASTVVSPNASRRVQSTDAGAPELNAAAAAATNTDGSDVAAAADEGSVQPSSIVNAKGTVNELPITPAAPVEDAAPPQSQASAGEQAPATDAPAAVASAPPIQPNDDAALQSDCPPTSINMNAVPL